MKKIEDFSLNIEYSEIENSSILSHKKEENPFKNNYYNQIAKKILIFILCMIFIWLGKEFGTVFIINNY